jgi:thymidylate kinase
MFVLEGTDAVGKTTVIDNLKEYDIKDRDKNICKLIDFNISLEERVDKIYNYLKQTEDYIIFLINNDKEELERRVNLRKTIDEYDKYTYLYNLLYLETYLYMEQNDLLCDKLFMVDCTGLSLEEQTNKVKKILDTLK